MKKFFLMLLASCCLLNVTFAQDTYTMKFLPQIPESQWYNATNQTEAKFSLGLPGISAFSFYIYNSGFTYHDVFQSTGNATNINMGRLFGMLQDMNYATAGTSISLFSLHVARDNTAVDLSINDRANVQLDYPRQTFNYLWYGNAHYFNQTVEIGNFGVNANWYREFALHISQKYKKWTFGLTPKLLFGKTNITTNSTSLKVNSDSANFYALRADANVNIQMSGIPDSAEDKKGFLQNPLDILGYIFNGSNLGWGGDFGVRYDFNERLNIAAGLNNVGFIRWNTWTHTYATNGTQTFYFNGLNPGSFFQNDSSAFASNSFRDSINHLVKLNEKNSSYVTYLPYDFYVLANYQLKHHWFGLQLSATKLENTFIYAATACYQLKFGKHFTGALTYTAKPYSPLNIGGGIVLRFAQLQLYVITDNWYAAVIPMDSKNTNLNVGLNIISGNRVKKVKPVDIIPAQEIAPLETPAK
jgi:Family of unknown function (DUF5723)